MDIYILSIITTLNALIFNVRLKDNFTNNIIGIFEFFANIFLEIITMNDFDCPKKIILKIYDLIYLM